MTTKEIEKYNRKPWQQSYYGAYARCNNTKDRNYKNYGGRGIKCLIEPDDFRIVWFRDKAYLMKRPSIDRIDVNGNYELTNCRYIELSENSGRRRNTSQTHCPSGHPYSGKNLIIRTSGGYRNRLCRICKGISNEKYRLKSSC